MGEILAFDVLIIGGGPAGSSLSYSLLKAGLLKPEQKKPGLKIGILDKAFFPRQKVCAGWVTPEVMQLLDIDLKDYASARVLQKISGFWVSQLGEQPLELGYHGEPVSYGIRRFEFDDYLLQRCGAELILGEAFKKMSRTANGWLVNDKYETKLVVGAGGHFCPVARAIGSKAVSELAVVAQEVEFKMSEQQKAACTVKQEIPELFFLPDLTGYGWVFRKGDYLNIGLGREDKSKLSGKVNEFCEYLTAQGKIPGDIKDKYSGHAYLLYPHSKRHMVSDNVLLIGDSAGLAYVRSGEGIRPAVESAILAAEVIACCNGDYSKDKLQQYNKLIEQRFGQRLPGADIIERLPAFVKSFVAGQLMKTHWFTRNFVIDKWFLQKQQPPLSAINK